MNNFPKTNPVVKANFRSPVLVKIQENFSPQKINKIFYVMMINFKKKTTIVENMEYPPTHFTQF